MTPSAAVHRTAYGVPVLRVAVPGASPLAPAVLDAVDMLARAGLVRLASAGDRVDLLHTIGDLADLEPEPPDPRRVHTFERIPLSRGRGIAAARWWTHRERRNAAGCTVLLAHGRTAGRVLVEAALAPSDRIHCLPLLATPTPSGATVRPRAAVRKELGVRPGVSLVVGVAARRPGGIGGWASAVERLRRTDVHLVRLAAVPPVGRPRVARTVSLGELLRAADLFVATGQNLTAVSLGASALAEGVPVVAVTTDSAAELISPGVDGQVVTASVHAIVDAVSAHLDGAPSPIRTRPTTSSPLTSELARGLLGTYRRALMMSPPARRSR